MLHVYSKCIRAFLRWSPFPGRIQEKIWVGPVFLSIFCVWSVTLRITWCTPTLPWCWYWKMKIILNKYCINSVCRPPNLYNWKIGIILLKNRKEIAFPIGVCSKNILKNRKILSKPIETWAGNGQNSDSFLQIHNGWEVWVWETRSWGGLSPSWAGFPYCIITLIWLVNGDNAYWINADPGNSIH